MAGQPTECRTIAYALNYPGSYKGWRVFEPGWIEEPGWDLTDAALGGGTLVARPVANRGQTIARTEPKV